MIIQAQLRRVVRDSLRLYFAPLTGAFKGIQAEFKSADREIERHRQMSVRRRKRTPHS